MQSICRILLGFNELERHRQASYFGHWDANEVFTVEW